MATSFNSVEILNNLNVFSQDELFNIFLQMFPGEELPNVSAAELESEIRSKIRRRLKMLVRVHMLDEKRVEKFPITDGPNYLKHIFQFQKDERKEGRTHHIVCDLAGVMNTRPIHEALSFLFCTANEHLTPSQHQGGYTWMFEDSLPGMTVNHYNIPQLQDGEDSEVFMDAVKKVLSPENVNLATVDGNNLTIITSNEEGWLSPLQLKIKASDKTAKRLKSLSHGYSITGRFKEVSLEIIEGSEKALDGIFFVSRHFITACLRQTKKLLGQEKFDQMMKRVRGAKIFSTRILCAHGKFLKGHAIVVDGQDFDIRTHACNLKKEVTDSPEWLIGMEPMKNKETTRTNIQYIINHNWLFPLESLKKWATTETRTIFCDITTGKVSKLTEKALEFIKEESDDPDTWHEEVKWMLGQVHLAGGKFENSPFMSYETFNQLSQRMLSVLDGKINITIPCARHCQIISYSAAREGNICITEPAEGTIRFVKEFGVAVVSDTDWLKMIDNHGGCDQDDFFDLIYREINGQKKVVVLRCPNDFHEYTLLNPESEDECPISMYYDQNKTEKEFYWPTLTMKEFPLTMSQVLKTGKSKIKLPKSEQKEGDYTKESVIEDVQRAMKNPGPGSMVNAKIAYNLVFGQLPDHFLSMEDAIDSNVMSRSHEALELVNKIKEDLTKQIKTQPMDEFLNKLKRFGCKKLYKGTPTLIVEHVLQIREFFQKEIKAWSQTRLEIPSKIIDALNDTHPNSLESFRKMLNNWRWNVAQLSREQQAKTEELQETAEVTGIRIKKLMEELNEQYNQRRNLLTQKLLQDVRVERIPAFAGIVLTQKTKSTEEISDYVLFNNLFRDSYLKSL